MSRWNHCVQARGVTFRHQKNAPRDKRMPNRPPRTQTPPMKPIRPSILLPLLSVVLVTSCVVPPGPGSAPVADGYHVYPVLPRGYVGGAYFLGDRYYAGGRYETGVFHVHGRAYHDRYYHGGRFYYGGRFENHGSPGHPQSSGRVDYRDDRDHHDHGDHGMNYSSGNPGPMNPGPQPIPGPSGRF